MFMCVLKNKALSKSSLWIIPKAAFLSHNLYCGGLISLQNIFKIDIIMMAIVPMKYCE